MHRILLTLASVLAATGTALAAPSFITFESGPVRPVALSPDGTRLFAANTPDGQLEIFNVGAGGISLAASVPVGLEPVAVAARNDGEVWVVNHLSDSVSIVDVASLTVTRTLLVGDEPRDIVFANGRAFITTAHRGQHRTHPSIAAVPGAGDPELTTPGVSRADVWVFDAADPGTELGGVPLEIVELFGDTPRALAVSPGGSTVYAAVFHSGNQTTIVAEGAVCDGFNPFSTCPSDPNGIDGAPGGNPGPGTNHEGKQAPEVGLIVKWDEAAGEWRDELDRNWNAAVKFDLPDQDVFAIDTATLNQTNVYSGVGTILFNMVVNPANGNIYVSNTEARNEVRFEGAGGGGSTVQGHLAEARITVLSGANVTPRHLNKHIDYDLLPAPAGTKDHSLATPVQTVVSADGSTLYVAAFGSANVGVFDTADLDGDAAWNALDPTVESANYLTLSGGGPAGLALDEARNRLYVLTRFDNAVAAIDLATGTEIAKVGLHNPEPVAVVDGRPFLYDATETSSNGEASCAACHVFGDLDSLAWNLGDWDGDVTTNPIPINLEITAFTAPSPINGTGNTDDFHPMKGPMTTQTLRGLVNAGAQHWRGDRSTGAFGTDPFDTELSFNNFIVAFPGLVGRDGPISNADMQKFTDFALEITLPPNPVRAIDNSLTATEQEGRDFYFGPRRADGLDFDGFGFTCNGCHVLDPASGAFGNGGNASFEQESQIMKIPHMRNAYQKVGMFGMPDVRFFVNEAGENDHTGDQIRGFGFLHDGSTDTLFRFFRADVFQDSGSTGFNGPEDGDVLRRSMVDFMMAFDSDLAPIVGQQITLSASAAEGVNAETNARITLMIERADTPFVSEILGTGVTECDLVVKGRIGGAPRGWRYVGNDEFEADDGAIVADAALRALANVPGQALTYTCQPPGSGIRAGVDRDLDGFADQLDNCPGVPNATQADGDADGVGDLCDSCSALANGDQRDTDGDGYGNACDPDLNNDCSVNFVDLGAFKEAFTPAPYDENADFDGDGFVNFVDLGRLKELFFNGVNPGPGPSGLTSTCD